MKNPVPCCPPVLHSSLGEAEAEELATALKALADPARLRILSFIAAQADGEACVCHLTGPIGLSQPTMTHHLQVLHGAGILEREKRGAWVYYSIVPSRVEDIRNALATRLPRQKPPARRHAAQSR